jgi:hypothetical protein
MMTFSPTATTARHLVKGTGENLLVAMAPRVHRVRLSPLWTALGTPEPNTCPALSPGFCAEAEGRDDLPSKSCGH